MKHIDLLQEVQECRRKALTLLGQPEATLLLRVAKELEQMETEQRSVQQSRRS